MKMCWHSVLQKDMWNLTRYKWNEMQVELSKDAISQDIVGTYQAYSKPGKYLFNSCSVEVLTGANGSERHATKLQWSPKIEDLEI